ncbi:hypothetical protein H4Q26_016156 [Puccinia striiformis f. sp. tritici PST-130]|nr:hypothetical protein H4Q26_016156 [Puccinia striiformis f. sp. tritici PST-130]
MEYDCHFIATSNQAGPLEIAEPIIAELNELATHGSIAYDAQLRQEVHFMVIPLCFLADSPMAAEITNTPNPGTSNNPCRVCHLQCPQEEEKSTLKYLQDFLANPTCLKNVVGHLQLQIQKMCGSALKPKPRRNLSENINCMASRTA